MMTFTDLVHRVGAKAVAKAVGRSRRFVERAAAGTRAVSRNLMVRTRRAFPLEFSADADVDAEIGTDTCQWPGDCFCDSREHDRRCPCWLPSVDADAEIAEEDG